ncbi:UNVERIFIED_CONTAM: hypothetical protein ABIC26_002965 [Paenibacillus sp. PvR008]
MTKPFKKRGFFVASSVSFKRQVNIGVSHHAKLLTPFLNERKDRLELVFLPPYSPELNAVEGLWKWLKSDVINNVFYHTVTEIRTNVLYFERQAPQFSCTLYTYDLVHSVRWNAECGETRMLRVKQGKIGDRIKNLPNCYNICFKINLC